MTYGTHSNLYYGIKVSHKEAKKIEDFFIPLAEFEDGESEEDREEFALYNGLEACGLESFNLVGENADGRTQNLEGYIEHYQNDIPYYAFGVWVSERKTKLSQKELNKKEKIIHEKWQKIIPYLDKLGLKNTPEYIVINQIV